MGDAISHAVLPGIVLAYIAGLPLAIGAFAAGLFCAVATGFIKQNSRIKEDTVMGVVFTGLFRLRAGALQPHAVGHASRSHPLRQHPRHHPVTKSGRRSDLGGVVLGVTLALRRDLLLICFDPGQARVMALPDRFLNYLLLGLLSLAIVVSLQAVGIILVIAMLVTPGSIAHLWTDRFDRMLLIAVVAAVGSTVVGIFISYHIDGSTGGCIVLVQALLFVLSLLFAPKYGMVSRRKVKAG